MYAYATPLTVHPSIASQITPMESHLLPNYPDPCHVHLETKIKALSCSRPSYVCVSPQHNPSVCLSHTRLW